MLLGDVLDEFVDIALIPTAKSALKSNTREEQRDRLDSCFRARTRRTWCSDSTGVRRWREERVCSIDRHDCDADGAERDDRVLVVGLDHL